MFRSDLKIISKDIQIKLKDQSKFGRFQRVADPNTFSKDIDEQFEAIQNAFKECSVRFICF